MSAGPRPELVARIKARLRFLCGLTPEGDTAFTDTERAEISGWMGPSVEPSDEAVEAALHEVAAALIRSEGVENLGEYFAEADAAEAAYAL